MSEPKLCHDGGSRSYCATCLDICARCFPSIASKHRNKNFHSPCVLVEQIPYAFNVIKYNSIDLTVFRTCHAVFDHGEIGVFHWDDCCFVSRSCPNIQVWSPVRMVEIKLGSFRPVPSARCSQQCGIPLIIAKQPWHKFCCNAPHIELIWQNSLVCSIQQSDNTANIVNRLSVSQIASCTFATFLVVVLIKDHLETSSSSNDIRPFLKWLNHL
jgi:hypothetical protein